MAKRRQRRVLNFGVFYLGQRGEVRVIGTALLLLLVRALLAETYVWMVVAPTPLPGHGVRRQMGLGRHCSSRNYSS